jgi:hypothetical protein
VDRDAQEPHQPPQPPVRVPERFSVGNAVRVKKGVTDPDFPDIPLGGWAGTVQEVDPEADPPLYLVAWNRRTLGAMHPVYRTRCERDGLDSDSMWLGGGDLEPDTGEPVAFEQPATLVARPLQPDEPEDRVRAVFRLTSDDPLPAVNSAALRRYRRHLASRLTFPFAALYTEEVGPFRSKTDPVLVLRLLPAEEGDQDDGLLVEVTRGDERLALPLREVEVPPGDPLHPALEDYGWWLENGPMDDPDQEGGPRRTAAPPAPVTLGRLLVLAGLSVALAGATLGAILRAVEGARYGVAVGAALVGLVGLLAGSRFGSIFGAVNRIPSGSRFGGFWGMVAGAALGALAGALVVAFVGSVLGSILVGLAGRALAALGWKPLGKTGWTLLGAWGGALVLAFYQNRDEALNGALYGAALGAGLGAFLALAFLVSLAFLGGFKQ